MSDILLVYFLCAHCSVFYLLLFGMLLSSLIYLDTVSIYWCHLCLIFFICSSDELMDCRMFLLSCSVLEIILLLDTLGLLFIWLSCWVFTIIFLSLYRDVSVNFFYLNSLGLLFVLTQLLFIAGDFLVYFIMFELTVIPLLVLLSLSSASVRKTYAVFYMIFFVMLGTILFLCTWCYFIEYSLWLSWVLMTSILLDGIDLLVVTGLALMFVLVKIPSFHSTFDYQKLTLKLLLKALSFLLGSYWSLLHMVLLDLFHCLLPVY